MTTLKEKEKGEILSIKTTGDGVSSSQQLEFMVGDTMLGGVISVDVDKIEPNSIVQATVKLHIKLG